jgi:hypothetical protein
LPADGGDSSVSLHEAVILLNTDHATNETEWEVGSDSGVVVQEGSSLRGEFGDIAHVATAGEVLVQKLSWRLQLVQNATHSAGKLSDPKLVAREGGSKGVDVVLEVGEAVSVPMQGQCIWELITTELAQPVLHQGDTGRCRGGRG